MIMIIIQHHPSSPSSSSSIITCEEKADGSPLEIRVGEQRGLLVRALLGRIRRPLRRVALGFEEGERPSLILEAADLEPELLRLTHLHAMWTRTGAIRSNQTRSDAIRCNQMQSDAIRRHQGRKDYRRLEMRSRLCRRLLGRRRLLLRLRCEKVEGKGEVRKEG